MSDKTPQQEGRDWEPVFAKSVGGVPIMMSGAGFTKLDVRGASVLWSLKWGANHHSISLKDAWMDEAIRAINGPGGIGGYAIPAIATKTAGYELMTFRKEDALYLMTSTEVSVADAKRTDSVDMRQRLPEFLR